VVQVPTKLNEEAKEALQAFDEACGNVRVKHSEKKKSFMDKIKGTFED